MSGQAANWNLVLRCCSAEVLQSFGVAVLQCWSAAVEAKTEKQRKRVKFALDSFPLIVVALSVGVSSPYENKKRKA